MTTKSITSDRTTDQEKQIRRFLEDAGDCGLAEVNPDKHGAQRLIEKGGDFKAYVIAGIRRFTAKTPNYDLARTILGKDFISPEDIAKARLGVVYTDEQLCQFGDGLPAQEVLEWGRDNGYLLVAGPAKAMSLLKIRELKSGYFYTKSEGWYAESNQKFSRDDKAEVRWIMLRKEPITNSTSKTWNEQQAFLSKDEVVPNVAEVAWCVTTYKAVRNIYLFGGIYVRTSSLDWGGHRVYVGRFGAGGLSVNGHWGDDHGDDVGLSAARKS